MNKVEMRFPAISQNESFARTVVCAFIMPLNPNVEELNDIKTAVSEGITNSVVHAYPNCEGDIELSCEIVDDIVTITIKDFGIGISDVDEAIQPFFTTKESEDRSGIGFTVIKSFTDSMQVYSKENEGVTIIMTKKILNKEKC